MSSVESRLRGARLVVVGVHAPEFEFASAPRHRPWHSRHGLKLSIAIDKELYDLRPLERCLAGEYLFDGEGNSVSDGGERGATTRSRPRSDDVGRSEVRHPAAGCQPRSNGVCERPSASYAGITNETTSALATRAGRVHPEGDWQTGTPVRSNSAMAPARSSFLSLPVR